MSSKFYILAIDGGGFRGAYSAYVLKRIEEKWGLDWRAQFDMFAGTSTGAIIAAGLACGLSARTLFGLYAEHGRKIFSRRWFAKVDPFGVIGLCASRYSTRHLAAKLREEFGDAQLGQITVPLVLPAVDIGSGQVHVFKSAYDDDFVRDPQVLVVDAVLASCAAPTFFDPHIVEPYRLADGGLWANNPALIAAVEAKRRLGVQLGDIRILSIGTGKSRRFYHRRSHWFVDAFWNSWRGWGFATRWGSSRFIDLLLNLQADTAHNILKLLLQTNGTEPEQILRINFESDKDLPMDSPRKLDDWARQADTDFTHNAAKISEFLKLSGGVT